MVYLPIIFVKYRVCISISQQHGAVMETEICESWLNLLRAEQPRENYLTAVFSVPLSVNSKVKTLWRKGIQGFELLGKAFH